MEPTCLPIKGPLSITGAIDPCPLVYVVTAYRWADKREHSYVVGCFTDQKLALAAVAAEEKYRAEKYKCEVLEVPLNERLGEGAVVGFRAVKLAFDRKGGAR